MAILAEPFRDEIHSLTFSEKKLAHATWQMI